MTDYAAIEEQAERDEARIIDLEGDVANLRGVVTELVEVCKLLGGRMHVNELVGKTDPLGLDDQAAYDKAGKIVAKAEAALKEN